MTRKGKTVLHQVSASPMPNDESLDETKQDATFTDIPLEDQTAHPQPSRPPSKFGKWSFGVLNDKYTEEVPGTVLLLASINEPLGVQRLSNAGNANRRTSTMPHQQFELLPLKETTKEKKRTPSGAMILDPQPDDSPNDPLNWSQWRRDIALLSLGFYCMIAGGVTPILAAGFNKVAETYKVTFSQVALTTGLYMMGLGVGGLFMSPTAILFGKRPVYLTSAVGLILTSIWCAASPSYISLATARVLQGISASPVECLPSATIAEIFFLHERAYRVGIYGLLLLGGKNIMPLISAVIIQACGWRWVFWIIAMIVTFCVALLFFFVPETFWDRTPRPASRTQVSLLRRWSTYKLPQAQTPLPEDTESQTWSTQAQKSTTCDKEGTDSQPRNSASGAVDLSRGDSRGRHLRFKPSGIKLPADEGKAGPPEDEHGRLPHLHNLNSPYYTELEKHDNYFPEAKHHANNHDLEQTKPQNDSIKTIKAIPNTDGQGTANAQAVSDQAFLRPMRYTTKLINGPRKRPFVLYAYPSVLWSALVYSISVGWLIVLSESVAHVYSSPHTYGFTPLQCGLVYLSPFTGGILGTAIAGKGSDFIVRGMARRNNGVYEPEFRLVMALPIALTTAIGLMGFGWSAEIGRPWIVPTVFFGIISFGCSLGATTAITFCVDSYRQFAGEALVTLNFSKNIFHGLAFSLFFPQWLQKRGSKEVFVILGVIEVVCLLTAIPMYVWGKRARMWTVRTNMMGKF